MDDPLYEWVRWCEPLASSSRPPPVTSVVLRRGRPRRRRRVVVGLRGRGARAGRGRGPGAARGHLEGRSEEHTSELPSLMRISYAGFCLKKNKIQEKREPRTT